MRRCAPSADRDSGFTLLEVLLAAGIMAMSAATIMVVYVHSVRQAGYSRDLCYATSAARNALEEVLAATSQESQEGDLPQRAGLRLRLDIKPAGEDLLSDAFAVSVMDKADGSGVFEMETKRAVYIQPEEPAAPGESDEGEEDARDGETQ